MAPSRRSTGAVLAAGLGYALGNIASADMAARVGGADLRAEGTRNPGAMNVHHVLGRRWAVAVTALDIGKGFVAARVGRRLAGDLGANVAASAAVIGHCRPLGRRGGKGVATSVGQVIGTFPVYLPIDVGVAAATATLPWFRQRTRAATTVASLSWVGCAGLWWRRGLDNPGGVRPSASLPAAAAVSSLVIASRFRHGAADVDAYNHGAVP